MNRKQRRKTGAPKERTYVLKESELEAIKRKAAAEAIQQYLSENESDPLDSAFLTFLSISVVVLKMTFKFGKQRNGVFLDNAIEIFEAVQNGDVKLDDVVHDAEKFVGYKFVEEDKS